MCPQFQFFIQNVYIFIQNVYSCFSSTRDIDEPHGHTAVTSGSTDTVDTPGFVATLEFLPVEFRDCYL